MWEDNCIRYNGVGRRCVVGLVSVEIPRRREGRKAVKGRTLPWNSRKVIVDLHKGKRR